MRTSISTTSGSTAGDRSSASVPGLGLPDDLARSGLEQGEERFAEPGVVIDHYDPDRPGRSGGPGKDGRLHPAKCRLRARASRYPASAGFASGAEPTGALAGTSLVPFRQSGSMVPDGAVAILVHRPARRARGHRAATATARDERRGAGLAGPGFVPGGPRPGGRPDEDFRVRDEAPQGPGAVAPAPVQQQDETTPQPAMGSARPRRRPSELRRGIRPRRSPLMRGHEPSVENAAEPSLGPGHDRGSAPASSWRSWARREGSIGHVRSGGTDRGGGRPELKLPDSREVDLDAQPGDRPMKVERGFDAARRPGRARRAAVVEAVEAVGRRPGRGSSGTSGAGRATRAKGAAQAGPDEPADTAEPPATASEATAPTEPRHPRTADAPARRRRRRGGRGAAWALGRLTGRRDAEARGGSRHRRARAGRGRRPPAPTRPRRPSPKSSECGDIDADAAEAAGPDVGPPASRDDARGARGSPTS